MTNSEAKAIFYSELESGAIAGKHLKDLLFDWIDWTLKLFENQNEMILKSTNDNKYFKMLRAFGTLCDDYTDALGDVFMSRISKGSNDQFFTPKHICELMSDFGFDDENIEHPEITDSACGSGRLLLAGVKQARIKGKEPKITGCDIDLYCCKMTLLNMLMQSIEGIIYHGNMQSNEFWSAFEIRKTVIGGKVIPYWVSSKNEPEILLRADSLACH